MATKKKTEHYVDNQKFYRALCDFRDACERAESEDRQIPVVPDYIAICIMRIAQGMSRRQQFSGYPFVEDMVADAVENCIRYVRSFDSRNWNNPFAYFSRVVWFAFLRRINIEKKGLYIKYKMTDMVNVTNMGATHHESGMGPESNYAVIEHSEHTQTKIDEFVENYERANSLRRKRRT